jgi:drug/metabolite transporter (DMT)-like permease
MKHINLSNKLNNNLQGIIYMIIATFLFSIFCIIINKLSSSLNVVLITSLATIISSLMVFIWVILSKEDFIKTPSNISIYIARGFCSGIGAILWVKVLRMVPVTEATAISYTTPILNIIAATIILKEKYTLPKFLAVITALIGGMVILSPAFTKNNVGYILAIFTTLLWVTGDILTKVQSQYDSVKTQCFYLFIIMAIFQAPFAIFNWSVPNLNDMLLIILLAIVQLLNLYCLFKSYSVADIVIVSPFDCGRLLFTLFFAYILYGETLNTSSLIGSVVIIISLIYLIKKSAKNTS